MLTGPTALEIQDEITRLDEASKRRLKHLRALLRVATDQEEAGKLAEKPEKT